MPFILIFIATAIFGIWCFLYFSATNTHKTALMIAESFSCRTLSDERKKKIIAMRKKLVNSNVIQRFFIKLNYSEKSLIKESAKLAEKSEKLRSGSLGALNTLPLAGYVLMDKLSINSESNVGYNAIVEAYANVYDREHAVSVVRFMMSRAISYIITSVSMKMVDNQV